MTGVSEAGAAATGVLLALAGRKVLRGPALLDVCCGTSGVAARLGESGCAGSMVAGSRADIA